MPPSTASRCFLPCNIKHKSSHKKHAIKMRETQFLLCTTLGNYNNTSPLFLNKLDVQSSNERCSRCGNKLSHFLHPACATSHNWVTVDYKISSEVSGFCPLQTHKHGEWPEATAYCQKKYVALKVTWKRSENASSLIWFFFELHVRLALPHQRRWWDSPAGFCC